MSVKNLSLEDHIEYLESVQDFDHTEEISELEAKIFNLKQTY